MNSNLMVVDDSSDQIELLKIVFAMTTPSLQITTAYDGDQALDMLRSNATPRPKVVLMDLRMPRKNGLETLQVIKNDPLLKTIPVCIFSSGDIEADICNAYSHCASMYFTKPTGITALKSFAKDFTRLWFNFASHC